LKRFKYRLTRADRHCTARPHWLASLPLYCLLHGVAAPAAIGSWSPLPSFAVVPSCPPLLPLLHTSSPQRDPLFLSPFISPLWSMGVAKSSTATLQFFHVRSTRPSHPRASPTSLVRYRAPTSQRPSGVGSEHHHRAPCHRCTSPLVTGPLQCAPGTEGPPVGFDMFTSSSWWPHSESA
jgi:hypothetical protein